MTIEVTTTELIDNVIFGMENQNHQFVFDLEKNILVSIADVSEKNIDRYQSLPDWNPVDGYNLMERFVASLHNTEFRDQLRNALSSGSGVFRRFKDVLRQHSDMQQLWFRFKRQAMENIVTEWLSTLLDANKMKMLKTQQSEMETEDLVMSDMLINPLEPGVVEGHDKIAKQIAKLDRAAFDEALPETTSAFRQYLYDRMRANCPDVLDEQSHILIAKTPDGELGGFLWSVISNLSNKKTIITIIQLYVIPHYRGLGLSNVLLEHFLEQAHTDNYEDVLFEAIAECRHLKHLFERKGLKPLNHVLHVG